MTEGSSSSLSSSPIPIAEEQNYSLKEEIVHLDQLFVESQNDTLITYKDFTDGMESCMMQNSKDSYDDDEEELFGSILKHQKEMRCNLEEELNKYRNQITSYQGMQREQSKIIDDMHNRIEEYRSRCVRLEAAIADASLPIDNSEDDLEFACDEENGESLQLKLDQERSRCQRLNNIIALYKDQLVASNHANEALMLNIEQLSKEYTTTQSELEKNEFSLKREEQSFNLFLTQEHHHRLSLWNHVRRCRSQFAKMKKSTEDDLSTVRLYLQNTTQQIDQTCLQLISASPSVEQSDNTELIQEVLRLNHELFILKQSISSEKRDLNKSLQDTASTIEKGKALLEEKDKIIETLNRTIETMRTSHHHPGHVSDETRIIYDTSYSASRCCRAIKEIGQIILDDSDHQTWAGVRPSSLTLIRKALLSSTPHSLNNICENTEFLESTVNGVQKVLQKRCLQIEELNLKLTAFKEKCSTQQKVMETLTADKKELNHMTAKLSSQLECLQNEMKEVVKNEQKIQSSFSETGSQKYFLEQNRKSQNELIEKLNSENDRLYQKETKLYKHIEQLQLEKDKLRVSEHEVAMDLSISNKKLLFLEDSMKDIEKKYQDSQLSFQKVLMDNELLEQEKQEFKNNLSEYEKQHTDLDLDIRRLKKENDALKLSVDSLQNANTVLTQDKKELSETINEMKSECDSLKGKFLKERSEFEKDKEELKEKYEAVHQRSLELETEVDILKRRLFQMESLREELEQAQNSVIQKNNGLISQITKLSHRKNLLEKELEQSKQELETQADSNKKALQQQESLTREKAEWTVKLAASERENTNLEEIRSSICKEKEHLERDLFSSQQTCLLLRDEKLQLEEQMGDIKSQLEHLHAQAMEIKHQKELEIQSMARQKDSLNNKLQQMEQEYDMTLKNLRLEHKLELDALVEEKESNCEHEKAVTEEFKKKLQEEIHIMTMKHAEEMASLKKQMVSHEQEIEERLLVSMTKKSSYEKKLESEKSSLQRLVEDLRQKLSNIEVQNTSEQKEMSHSTSSYQFLLEDKEKEISNMREELKNLSSSKKDDMKTLEAEIKELKQEKVNAIENINNVTIKLDSIHLEKKALEGELEKISCNLDDERRKREELEQRVVILQQKLNNERKQVELVRNSHEDLKARLKKNQFENNDLKHSLQQSRQKIQSLEASSVQYVDDFKDMKDTMRELEASRMDAKREIQSLRRSLVTAESINQSQSRELSEMQFLMTKSDEVENELKDYTFKLKQKVMEAEASKDATFKEMTVLQHKLLDIEQKLKFKQEEHNASLQETLSGETSLAEQRLGFEKSLSLAKEELQQLRLRLTVSEGRAVAFEKHIFKLEGSKGELENKLHILHLSLRSFLGIGADSGFRGSSTQLLISPFSSRRESPSKFAENFTLPTSESTPFQDHQPASSSTPFKPGILLSVADLDIDLIRTALHDFMQRLSNAEKEKDDLRSDLCKAQKEMNDTNNKIKVSEEKLHRIQRELEIISKDGEQLENQLVAKKENISKLEDIVRNLEEEKRRLFENNKNLLENSAISEKERNILQGKVAELRESEALLKKQQEGIMDKCEMAEARTTKAEILYNKLETEKCEILARKAAELESFQNHIEELKTSLHDSETKLYTLRLSIDHQNAVITRYKHNETVLQEKLESLEMSLTDATLSTQQLNKDLLQLNREHGSCEHEKSFFRNECQSQRSIIAQLKAKNETLKGRINDLIEATKNYELQKAELEGQLLGYQNVVSYNEISEKTSNEKVTLLVKEKYLLEEELLRLKNNFSKNEELRLQAEKQKHKFSKENSLLCKALDKLEKERQKTEEIASRSVFERAALGKSLSKLEMENQQLMQKIQNLQVQLVELEQQHMERVKDLDKKQKFEMQLELERLKSTQKHMEKLLSTKEKSHYSKIIGLEQQIETLQEHLKQAHSTWKGKMTTRSASVSFLNDFHNDSLQRSSGSEELARHLDLSSSPSHSPNKPHSTLQVCRRIDKIFPSQHSIKN